MKTAHILIFSVVFIIGIILFNSLSVNNPIKSASNIPTQIPEPAPESPTPTQIISKTDSKVQIIKATYGPPFGFYPTEFTVKAGIPVRLEAYAPENGRGCMGSIMLPELLPNNIQGFTKDKTNIFEFTPTTPGTYSITCAMGVPHGLLTVK